MFGAPNVTEIVMFAVATGRRAEVDLLVRGLAPMFPPAWERFHAGRPDRPARPVGLTVGLTPASRP